MSLKLILIAACIFLTGNISAQQSDKMEKRFDIKRFKENIEDGKYRFQLNDTTEVVQTADGNDYFLERLIFNGSQKETRYAYFYDNGKLAAITHFYCDELVDTTEIYNVYGELVQEKNEDEGYNFTMDDLRVLIKKLFKVDILYPESKYLHSILRFNEEAYISKKKYPNATSIYVVRIATSPTRPRKSHALTIDGNTGEILSHVDDKGKELVDPKAKAKTKAKTVAINKNDEHNWTPLLD